MTTPAPKGWLAKLQATMAPLADPDDKTPIVRPAMVLVSMAFGILSGLIFLISGVLSGLTVSKQVDLQVTAARKTIAEATTQCEQTVGGVGSAAATTLSVTPTLTSPIPATQLVEGCKQLDPKGPPQDQIDSFRNTLTIISWVIALVGAAVLAATVQLRTGARWTRRVLVGVAVVMLGLAMFLQVSNVFTLAATLLLVVCILLVYVGKGGLYFARLAMQNRRH